VNLGYIDVDRCTALLGVRLVDEAEQAGVSAVTVRHGDHLRGRAVLAHVERAVPYRLNFKLIGFRV